MSRISVLVVMALPDKSLSVSLSLEENADVASAVAIAEKDPVFSEVKFKDFVIGIYGELCELSQKLSDGDRIELYRPCLLYTSDAADE